MSSAVSPPALTIFRRRSLTESSLTAPIRVQCWVAAGSVVSRTRRMASRSASSAAADAADSSSAIATTAGRFMRPPVA